MYRGMKLLKRNIQKIDVFLEVRDSRAPISTFNPEIDEIIKEHQKLKIVLFNKYDLCEKEKTNKTIAEMRLLGHPTLAISSKERRYDF